jgi:oligopeptide/dipeptide ABC transporter ATP-binding protein
LGNSQEHTFKLVYGKCRSCKTNLGGLSLFDSPPAFFGGGKTHGLTAIYHLAKGARPKDIETFVDSSVLPKGPVQVAALVGDALDPVAGVTTNGIKTYTLWGDLPSPVNPPAGCVFNTRCWKAQDKCRTEVPQLMQIGTDPTHRIACHYPED